MLIVAARNSDFSAFARPRNLFSAVKRVFKFLLIIIPQFLIKTKIIPNVYGLFSHSGKIPQLFT